jgi:sugar/nucleoside kinase (ribokinase family)
VLSDPVYDGGNGERIFINNIGAAWEFLPDDLEDDFFRSDMVVFGGTALVPNIHEALTALLDKSRRNKAITVVNTVYDFLNEKKDPSGRWPLGKSVETYRNIDLLITDMEEALRLSGATRIEGAMDFFMSAGVGAAIITHGSNPVHFFANSRLFGNIPFSELPVSERVVRELRQDAGKTGDTTGCGDNFTGGVIASLARQLVQEPDRSADLKDAIALGVASGGYACFYHGGTSYEDSPGQKLHQVDAYYRDYLEQTGLAGRA